MRVAGALRRAGELEDADWAAAIDVLAEANRAAPSAELESALVALRAPVRDPRLRRGSGARAPVAPRSRRSAQWAARDRPRRARRAEPARRGARARRACWCGVRSPEDDAAGIAEAIDRCWAVSTSEDPPGPADAGIWEPFWPADGDGGGEQWVRGIRNWVRAAGGVLLCDSPAIQFRILDLYRRIGLQAVVTEYLGGRPVLSANKCTLRRVSPETVGGWHQDGAFLGAGVRAVNLWLALTDCGIDAPGMDLVARRLDGVVTDRRPRRVLRLGRGATRWWRRPRGPAGSCAPEFRAGDLLIFDELMLHRTAAGAVHGAATGVRSSSGRSRADAYPDGHIRLVW